MFTGIIEGVGRIRSFRKKGYGVEIEVEVDFNLERSNVGDSISVNGCCLTVTSRLGKSFWADLSPETLACTTLGKLKVGDPVNLERALKVGQRVGGHIVQGHVDHIAKVIKINKLSNGVEFFIEVPPEITRYMVEKGSVAVDGVSLTINHCEPEWFSVMIVPHTALVTTFSRLAIGDEVNLEVDILGKYVEKLHFLDSEQFHDQGKITEEFLKKHGF